MFNHAVYGREVIRREVIAGITAFLATMYIIVVNPSILAKTGLSFNGVLTATVLVSAFSSILMGWYAKSPIVVAPGMGLNAFFTYTLVLGQKVPVEKALGAVFWAGVIFLILSLTKVRQLIVQSIPRSMRAGIAVGIGLFICLIGFSNGQLIGPHPATIISKQPLHAANIVFICGVGITAWLALRRVQGALMLGIGLTTLMAWPIGRWIAGEPLVQWQGLIAMPDFSLIGALDIRGSFALGMLPAIFSIAFVDLFDSLSTFVGVAEAGHLLDEQGEPRHIREALIVDAWATAFSGVLGTSSATSYIESAAGIREGGRLGLMAIVAGVLFLPFMFLSPLLAMVPAIATAPALVLVGLFMMGPVRSIVWEDMEEGLPAFLAMILIPLSYSISTGISWGFISWTFMRLVHGRWREIKPTLWFINIISIISIIH